MRYEGYKPSTLDLNSPEIQKIAYGPEMNDHVERLRKHHNSKGSGFKRDVGLEFADHCNFKDKAPVSTIGKGIRLPKVMSNEDRRNLGIEQDSDLPDYQPMVDQAKGNRQTKGASHGIKKHKFKS